MGFGRACLKQDATRKDGVLGLQTVPRAEVMALVVIAEASMLQVCSRSEWTPSTSSLPPESLPDRNKGSMATCGDDSSMPADSKPQRIIQVTRVRRSLTAKELEIGYLTLFDVRGNTFADEMAGRAAKIVEVLPILANAVQAIDGVPWQNRMRIIEAHLAAFSGQPQREFLPPRTPVHRKTRQQQRNELLETQASVQHAIIILCGRREIDRCAICG